MQYGAMLKKEQTKRRGNGRLEEQADGKGEADESGNGSQEKEIDNVDKISFGYDVLHGNRSDGNAAFQCQMYRKASSPDGPAL